MRRIPLIASMLAGLAACAPPPGAPPASDAPRPVEPAAAPAAPRLPTPTRGDGPPARDPAAPLSRIVVTGGVDPARPVPLLAAVAATRPDLLVVAGDIAAAPSSDPELGPLREAYGLLSMNAHFSSLNMATPMLATCGAAPPPETRALAEQLFERFWRDAALGRDRPGVYGARVHGPQGREVQLLLLDTCSFRTADGVLGEAQWAWLEEELRRPAVVRLLVTGAPVLGDGGWNAAEHARLAGLLRRNPGAVLVSAGAGSAAFRQAGVLREAAAESLNLRADAAFVLAEVDWARGRLRLSLRNASGAVARTEVALQRF